MGYTTEFDGTVKIVPSVKPEHEAYIKVFSKTRRMKRDPKIAEQFADPIRIAAGLGIGVDGEYCVAGLGFMGHLQEA